MTAAPSPREKLLDAIPRSYSGRTHFALINLLSLAAVGFALSRVSNPTTLELLLVPTSFVFANFFEWWIHRGPMHHRTRGFDILFKRHTLTHHVVFEHDSMEVTSPRDLALVLFPPWFLPLALLLTSPIPLTLTFLGSANLGWLFFASVMAYYLVYEWFHLLHHLPRRHRVVRALAFVSRGHVQHHDPAQMTRGNFNVSFPLADWVLGTWLPEPAPAEAPATD